MVVVQGKLSSYFTSGRERPGQGSKGASGEGSTRDRLRTKLQVRQQTGFAFNFKLDEDPHAKDKAREQEPFRSRFSSSDSALYNEKDAEGICSSRVDGFGIDLRESVSQPTVAKQKKKKPSGKKSHKGKGKTKRKGKCKGQGTVDSDYDSATQAYREAERNVNFSSGTHSQLYSAGGLDRKIIDKNTSSKSDNVVETPQPNPPSTGIGDVVPPSQSLLPLPAISRPPPGLTLESWKDPALTVDERRRRRFGRGVRNLAAIQRSCESRKGLPASSGGLPENMAEADDRGVKSDADRVRQVGSLASVFAFGFDIGISFNGGS